MKKVKSKLAIQKHQNCVDGDSGSDDASESSSGDELERGSDEMSGRQDTHLPAQADTDSEYAKIRSEMKQMSFGELMKMQERLGSKMFNEVYHGETVADDETTEKNTQRKIAVEMDRRKAKRFQCEKPVLHKDEPTEASSKKKTSRFRNVVAVQKRKGRDPRFDDSTGEYNEEIFMSNYSFLQGIKSREKDELEKEFKNESDAERQRQLKLHIRRLKRSEANEIKRQTKRELLKTVKQKEKEMVKEGKKPFFMKKSEKKDLELVDHFKKLKDTGRLEAYMKAKRKKNAQKHRNKMPD